MDDKILEIDGNYKNMTITNPKYQNTKRQALVQQHIRKLQENVLVAYTDASSKNGHHGVAYNLHLQNSKTLRAGNRTSIEVESEAIKFCLEDVIKKIKYKQPK